jgi:hypothetical protein
MNVPENLHGPLVFVDVEQSQRECFEALRKHLGVIGSQAFMVAATWGYLRGQTPGEVQRSGKGWARLETFTPANRLEMLALALGYSSGRGVEDFEGCWRACEGYAKEGMTLLRDELEKPGKFQQRFAALVLEELNEVQSQGADVSADS